MTALLRQSATWKFVHHLCHVEVCGNLSESTWCQPNPALGEMTARDDFSQKTKRFVALRAGYMCSFAGCSQLTTGPSDESSWAVGGIGDAAHICAASPGGKRYDASMSPKERSHIDNAIWLCANHARLIDRDDVAYTADDLRQMKRAHEAACAEKVRWSEGQSVPVDDLIALGPGIVAIGEILAFDGSSWDILLRHFVIGDVITLIGYADSFASARDGDRYVLVNAIGDGRELTAAPAVTRTERGYQVRCSVAPSSPRTAAQQLGSQWAISPKTNDLFVENGQIARVSGLPSLPQVVTSCFSMLRGESPFHPDYGTRLAEYYDAFLESPWLGQLLKLEAIRQAAIPYHDEVLDVHYTPLRCVEQVVSVDVLAEAPEGKRLPIKVAFEVKGVGRWDRELSIFMPSPAGERSESPVA